MEEVSKKEKGLMDTDNSEVTVGRGSFGGYRIMEKHNEKVLHREKSGVSALV